VKYSISSLLGNVSSALTHNEPLRLLLVQAISNETRAKNSVLCVYQRDILSVTHICSGLRLIHKLASMHICNSLKHLCSLGCPQCIIVLRIIIKIPLQ